MKSTILELAGASAIVIGLWLIQPLSLIVGLGVALVALGYTRGVTK
jgi:small-conductance mechanosensitive channel